MADETKQGTQLGNLLGPNGPLLLVLAALGYMPLQSVSRSAENVAESQTEIREDIRAVRSELTASQVALRNELDNLREGVSAARVDRWTRADHESFFTREVVPLRARVDRIERELAVMTANEREDSARATRSTP